MSTIKFLEEEVRLSKTIIHYFHHDEYGDVELHDIYEDDKHVDSYAYDKWGTQLSYKVVEELDNYLINMKNKK